MKKLAAHNKPPLPVGKTIRDAARRIGYATEDRRWDRTTARNLPALERLASAALDEARAGRTEPLDPDRL